MLLQQESLDAAHQRHAVMHAKLRDSLNALGTDFLVDEEYRLPLLNTVTIPGGVNDAAVRARLLNEHNLEIGAEPGVCRTWGFVARKPKVEHPKSARLLGALAGKVWRIGLMGHSAKDENIDL